ncbi:MAG: hypothetical protein LBF15_03185 [Candidatus Peribacteria bacterium]|jgi:hypothetical protein|nr:hypothetical protein [Candidatus Peribacteria bacterium]
MLRKAHFTGEIMILLSFSPEYFEKNIKLNKDEKLSLIKDFLINLAKPPSPATPLPQGEGKKSFPNIKSIYFSHNVNKADTAI